MVNKKIASSDDTDFAVKIENVSKKFSNNLKRSMMYGIKDIGRNIIGMRTRSHILRKSEFWAVDDVSFELKKGECIGIIGPNGSGKSTILKMLNGIYWPDKGKITVNGRVGALIEIGAGFHPMLTGRENIYLNAAILGMTKEDVDEKFDKIIKFADIGDFIDTPVKFYSSGMFVRLGFSVLIHCETDILLVDEILAVGDAAFRRKSSERMKKLVKGDKSVIFISHNMQSVESIADKGLLLDKGKSVVYGNLKDVIGEYEIMMRPKIEKDIEKSCFETENNGSLKLVHKYHGWAGDEISIKEVWVESLDGERKIQFSSEEDIVICISYKINSDLIIKDEFIEISFFNEHDINCMGARLKLGTKGVPNVLPKSGTFRVCFKPVQLTTSTYRISITFFDHTYDIPYAQGQYGYVKVINDIPTRMPGENTPLCWSPCEWHLESGKKQDLTKSKVIFHKYS